MALKDDAARSTRLREQMGEDAWAALRIGLILTCRAAVGPQGDWSILDRRLGEIAAARYRDEADLVSTLLDDLSDPAIRRAAVEQTRALAMALSQAELRKVTRDVARLVDRACPDQSFAFRAGLTLISLWVTENT